MKPIKDCEWIVKILNIGGDIQYLATSNTLLVPVIKDGNFKDIQSAKDTWIEFAKINGITNYKFV